MPNVGSPDAPWLANIQGDALPHLINSDRSYIRVIAGPGSGKTTGLKRRIQRLVLTALAAPGEIFVGTFTRAIANELDAELGQAIVATADEDRPDRVKVSTLHSHALKLLTDYPGAREGRLLKFLLQFEKDIMLYDVGVIHRAIASQRKRQDELKHVCAEWARGAELETAGFVGAMDQWLRFHGGMLIDEVVNVARRGLLSGAIPSGQFNHVVIDEYQDLTLAEQTMVKAIWSGNGSLVVLGDDDQSIYSFRYNHPGGIAEFEDHCPHDELDDVTIAENRRCGTTIVGLANAMMAAAGTTKPPMIAMRVDEGDLSFIHWPTLDDEIRGLARYMQERSDTKFLVLVPRRFIGYRLRRLLGAEASTSFNEQMLEVPLVQDRFALASLLVNEGDRIALRACLAFDSSGVRHANKCNSHAYSSIANSSLEPIALLLSLVDGSNKPRGIGAHSIVARAHHVLDELSLGENETKAERLLSMFNPNLANVIEEEEKREKARDDLSQIHEALRRSVQTNPEDIAGAVEKLRYRIAMRHPLIEQPDARISIMTHHGAKGLQADVVIVAGAADQIIPGTQETDPAREQHHREEQRRLLYVSITRARQELVISWPNGVDYEDAIKNNVRIDKGSVWGGKNKKVVRLGRTSLLPEFTKPLNGVRWLKDKLG